MKVRLPCIVVEIVSNLEGNETGSKLQDSARAGVPYYAIFDPQRLLSPDTLRVFESRGGAYELLPDAYMPRASLGLVLWTGEYEGKLGDDDAIHIAPKRQLQRL